MTATWSRTSTKYLEARESLPEELRAIYDQLVEEYSFHTEVAYGRGYVAYQVLAALVRDGWRPEATKERGRPSLGSLEDQSVEGQLPPKER